MRFKLCGCRTNLWSPPPSPVQSSPEQIPDSPPTLLGPSVPDVSGLTRTSTFPETLKGDTAPETNPLPVNSESTPGESGGPNNQARVSGTSNSATSDMVSSVRTPLGAWHTVTAKIVAANRFRAGASSHVGEFRIEELGGKSGHLVFGPVAVFNGNISLGIKKPMVGMTLTIMFTGVAEVDKNLVTFLSISHELYSGDLQEGFRTFLFGFNFPHLNLPPTSASPLIHYSFVAKLSRTGAIEDHNSSIGSRIPEFKSKPLEIVFIPYVDPALEFPPLPRLLPHATVAKDKGSKGKGIDTSSTKSVGGAESPTNGPLKVPKPKLTLTTADLPLTASSNSTPIIDKPCPIDTSVLKTTSIRDDNNKTVARLTVDLQKTRFLPDDEILVQMQLAIRDGDTMPKGFGVKVIEKRCLAKMDCEASQDDGAVSDEDEDGPSKLNIVGKERVKVLTGKKFTVHSDDIKNVQSTDINIPDRAKPANNEDKQEGSHQNLAGGKKIEMPIRIRLPTFKTFINEILLPTVALPLGELSAYDPSEHPSGIPDSSSASSRKGKSPISSTATSPTTTNASIHKLPPTPPISFIVVHVLQVTVPTNTFWFKKPSSSFKDLEISVPIVLGNINPHTPPRKKTSDLRMSVLEERRYGGGGAGASSSRSGRKGSMGSVSGHKDPAATIKPGWKEGERFLTLEETDLRPGFIKEF